MGKRSTALISALPALKPNLIINTLTGEIITQTELDNDLEQLVTQIVTTSETYYNTNKTIIDQALTTYTGYPQPESYARSQGWKLSMGLPREVKAKSRVERLASYHMVQTVSSHILNQDPHKQAPSFSKTINLGAVDNQMVSLQLEGNQLVLNFKCWTSEYELHFNLPPYLAERNIIKYSLPIIRLDKMRGWVFNFSVQEQPKTRDIGTHAAGVDLGRVEPYAMAIVNGEGNCVAHYVTGGRLKRLNLKRERLIVEKKHILTKAKQYEALGLDPTILWSEYGHKRAKITILGNVVAQEVGAEVTRKLIKHKVSLLNVEDLRWATGAKYGSRWNHSAQQVAITHSLAREGLRVRKVNPRNTSQECHKCGARVVHDSKRRTVWCVKCKAGFDRDFNAAMNIARNKNKSVSPPGTGGVGVTIVESLLVQQVTGLKNPNSMLRNKNRYASLTSVTSPT